MNPAIAYVLAVLALPVAMSVLLLVMALVEDDNPPSASELPN